jgi:hypothetical protein
MTPVVAQIIQKLLSFLEKLPYILVSFGIGKKLGSAGKMKTEKDLIEAKIEIEKKKNELEVIDKYHGMSDDDIIKSAIKSGAVFKLPGKGDPGKNDH